MNQNVAKVLPIKQVQIIHEAVEEEGVVEAASSNLLVELALNVAKTVTWAENVQMLAAVANIKVEAVINADRKAIWAENVLKLVGVVNLEAKGALNADKKVIWAETALKLVAMANLETEAALNAEKKVIWVGIVQSSSKIQMTLLTPQLNWLVVAGPLFQAQIGMLTNPRQLLSPIVAGEMTKLRTLNQ